MPYSPACMFEFQRARAMLVDNGASFTSPSTSLLIPDEMRRSIRRSHATVVPVYTFLDFTLFVDKECCWEREEGVELRKFFGNYLFIGYAGKENVVSDVETFYEVIESCFGKCRIVFTFECEAHDLYATAFIFFIPWRREGRPRL